ncbi:hypothetical protein F66182_3229, partial [Fusarium sp. NRRL 66182]
DCRPPLAGGDQSDLLQADDAKFDGLYPCCGWTAISFSRASDTSEGKKEFIDVAASTLVPLEDSTMRHVSATLDYLIEHCQDVAEDKLVEFRPERLPVTWSTFTAVDDGGICLQTYDHQGRAVTVRNRVAIVEAKRGISSVVEGKPVVSDAWLAQMTCQAIGAKMGRDGQELEKINDVIVIAVAQTFWSFLQFKMTVKYIEKLDNPAAVNQAVDEPYLHVDATDWFDMGNKEGRTNVLKNISALINGLVKELG